MTTKKHTPLPEKEEGRWVTKNGATYWTGRKPTPIEKRGAIDDSGRPIYIIDKKTGQRRQALLGELGPNTKRVK